MDFANFARRYRDVFTLLMWWIDDETWQLSLLFSSKALLEYHLNLPNPELPLCMWLRVVAVRTLRHGDPLGLLRASNSLVFVTCHLPLLLDSGANDRRVRLETKFEDQSCWPQNDAIDALKELLIEWRNEPESGQYPDYEAFLDAFELDTGACLTHPGIMLLGKVWEGSYKRGEVVRCVASKVLSKRPRLFTLFLTYNWVHLPMWRSWTNEASFYLEAIQAYSINGIPRDFLKSMFAYALSHHAEYSSAFIARTVILLWKNNPGRLWEEVEKRQLLHEGRYICNRLDEPTLLELSRFEGFGSPIYTFWEEDLFKCQCNFGNEFMLSTQILRDLSAEYIVPTRVGFDTIANESNVSRNFQKFVSKYGSRPSVGELDWKSFDALVGHARFSAPPNVHHFVDTFIRYWNILTQATWVKILIGFCNKDPAQIIDLLGIEMSTRPGGATPLLNCVNIARAAFL